MKRIRYQNRAPVRVEFAQNGADEKEVRYPTVDAAEQLGVTRVTLFRWWDKAKFPSHCEEEPDIPAPYQPDIKYVGEQQHLLWPQSVITRIKKLLDLTARVEGIPGHPRLPRKPFSFKVLGTDGVSEGIRKQNVDHLRQQVKEGIIK